MRAAIIGLASVCIAGSAQAADWLRGSVYDGAPPPASFRWSGFYVGAQIGYADANFDVNKATQPLVANAVRALLVETEAGISGLPNLPSGDARGMTYGGFVGYNAQWGDVVMGLELNYNRTNLKHESSDTIARSFVTSNQFRNDVQIDSNIQARITDYATVRARAGYAMGWIMPYGFAALAIGQVNYRRSARVRIVETDVSPSAIDPTDGIPPRPGGSLDVTAVDSRNNAITVGYAGGAGVDVGLTPNLFVRGEWEYMHLAPVGGVAFRINTFRAAAAVKF
jgi:opacity protein-like surface antigen